MLAIAVWDIGMLMDIENQSISAHMLSKYFVDVACLSEVHLPHADLEELLSLAAILA